MSDDNDSMGIVIFGVGIVVGSFFTYLIMKGKEQQPAQQPTLSPATMQNMPGNFHAPQIPQDTEQPAQQPTLSPATMQNMPGNFHAPQIPQDTEQPAPVMQSQIPEPTLQALHNEEVWEIKKDNRGRLEGIIAYRKANYSPAPGIPLPPYPAFCDPKI